MAATADTLNLGPDNLAFVFDSNVGVSASDLGLFLQRAATVSRQAGVDLYVVGLHEGSLAVVARVLRRTGQASIEEFKSSPVRTTGAALGVVALVSAALVAAMHPTPGQVSPLAKAGAALVEKKSVTQISLVTINKTVVVMDKRTAADVRMWEAARSNEVRVSADVRQLVTSATKGNLSGTVVPVGGDLHFRPDGFRYLVPIDRLPRDLLDVVQPGKHLVVWGDLRLRDSQPDMLIIREVRLE